MNAVTFSAQPTPITFTPTGVELYGSESYPTEYVPWGNVRFVDAHAHEEGVVTFTFIHPDGSHHDVEVTGVTDPQSGELITESTLAATLSQYR